MKIKTIYGIIILVVVLGLGIFSISKPKQNNTIIIGAALALSGDAAAWGEEERNGILLALEDLNDPDIKVIFEDTQTHPTHTINAGNKLVSIDNVDVIIGPTWLDSFNGFIDVSERNKIITISPSTSITAIHKKSNVNDTIFSTWFRSDNQVRNIMQNISDKGIKNISLFYQNDTFTLDVVNIIKSESAEYGMSVVHEFATNGHESDFKTALLKAKNNKAEVIVFWFAGAGETVPFLKQRKVLEMDEIPLYTTEWIQGFVNNDEYKDITNNIYYSVPELNNQFIDQYEELYGVKPGLSASNAYDTLNILIETIEKVGTDPTAIQEYLENTEFETITFGKVSFDEIHGVDTGAFKIKKSY